MLKWLINQKETLEHHEAFKDEYEDYQTNIINVFNWIKGVQTIMVPLVILQSFTFYGLLYPSVVNQPHILVALIAGYAVWLHQIFKIRQQRFLTEGLCMAVHNLQNAIVLFDKLEKQEIDT